MKQTFIFKSLADLLIALQKDFQNLMNSINSRNQLNYYLNLNINILRNPVWLNDKILKQQLANTSSLMSQYKLTPNSPGNPALIQFHIVNLVKKPISVATLDVFKHSTITDIPIIEKETEIT
jgi:hypothetical protein